MGRLNDVVLLLGLTIGSDSEFLSTYVRGVLGTGLFNYHLVVNASMD